VRKFGSPRRLAEHLSITFLLISWAAMFASPAQAQNDSTERSPRCRAAQLSATEDKRESDEVDGGAGHQAMVIVIQNRSSVTCTLQGIPALTSARTSVTACSNCGDYLFPSQSVEELLLEPARSAYVLVGYLTQCRRAAVPGFRLSDRRETLRISIAGLSCGPIDVTSFLGNPAPVGFGDSPKK
jgi:hypothetical protein